MENSSKFCHYFSNIGKCTYEELSGKKCRYKHEKAPMCHFDDICNRNKCMYSHTKPKEQRRIPQPNYNSSFLDQGRQPQQMNQWEMMTAFMQTAQTQRKPLNQRQQGKPRGRW